MEIGIFAKTFTRPTPIWRRSSTTGWRAFMAALLKFGRNRLNPPAFCVAEYLPVNASIPSGEYAMSVTPSS
jgi:hypothetical protein